jgi:hypothetical protein
MKRKAKVEKPIYYFTPGSQEIDCTNYGNEKDAAYIKVLNGILKIPFTGIIIPKPSEILPNASGSFYPFETNIKVIEIDELPKYQTHYLWEEDDFTKNYKFSKPPLKRRRVLMTNDEYIEYLR